MIIQLPRSFSPKKSNSTISSKKPLLAIAIVFRNQSMGKLEQTDVECFALFAPSTTTRGAASTITQLCCKASASDIWAANSKKLCEFVRCHRGHDGTRRSKHSRKIRTKSQITRPRTSFVWFNAQQLPSRQLCSTFSCEMNFREAKSKLDYESEAQLYSPSD